MAGMNDCNMNECRMNGNIYTVCINKIPINSLKEREVINHKNYFVTGEDD
jgi:hypothetical protein